MSTHDEQVNRIEAIVTDYHAMKVRGERGAASFIYGAARALGTTVYHLLDVDSRDKIIGAMREGEPLQDRVGRWGEATFPRSTPESIVAHMHDEALELCEAVAEYERGPLSGDALALMDNISVEAADVYLLLLHLAHRYGFDLHQAAEDKFAVIQTRTYTTDSGRGYIRHDAAKGGAS